MSQTKQKKRKSILSDRKKTRRRRRQQKGGFPFGIVPVVIQDKNNHFLDFQVDSNTIDRGLYAKKHHYFPLMRRAKMPNDFDFKNVHDKTYNFFHQEPKKFKIKTVKIAANTDEDIEKMKVLNKIVRHMRKNEDVVGGINLSQYEKTLLNEMGLDELGVKELLLKKEAEKREVVKDINQMYVDESDKNRLLESKLSQYVRMYGPIEDESSLEFDPENFSSLPPMKPEIPLMKPSPPIKPSAPPKDESTIKLEKKLEDLENKVATLSSAAPETASAPLAPAPAPVIKALVVPSLMPPPSLTTSSTATLFKKGDKVTYIKDGNEHHNEEATILSADNESNDYSIQFADGTEKQTVEAYLKKTETN